MNVKIPTAKDEPKYLPTAKTPVWFTRVSASLYNDTYLNFSIPYLLKTSFTATR